MTEKTPRSPCCNSPGIAQGTSGFYACKRCGGLFDDDPEEGGDYHSRDVSRRIERNERKKTRRR